LKSERKRNARARAHHPHRLRHAQSTLTRGTHLAHNQRLIDRRKLPAKVRARAIARVNAKRLGRRPPARDKPRDYPLADDSFWAADEDEDDPELDLKVIQGPFIAHPPRTARRPRLAPPAAPPPPSGRRARTQV
jgi:hypothetical protein